MDTTTVSQPTYSTFERIILFGGIGVLIISFISAFGALYDFWPHTIGVDVFLAALTCLDYGIAILLGCINFRDANNVWYGVAILMTLSLFFQTLMWWTLNVWGMDNHLAVLCTFGFWVIRMIVHGSWIMNEIWRRILGVA
jgi:hypothetical protein